MNQVESTLPASQKSQNAKLGLQAFLDILSSYDSPVPVDFLKELLEQLELTESEIGPFQQFCDSNYQRNLVASGAAFEMLVLCFEAGQRTPIHDHAGSACGVKVLKGQSVETEFGVSQDGWLYATESKTLPEGGVVGSVDMDIHQLSNLQPEGKRLITIHVYSPPLGEVGNYSIVDNSVKKTKACQRSVNRPS